MDILYAYDCSGSTYNCEKYHKISAEILRTLPSSAKIVKWDTEWERVSSHELAKINADKDGFGGTDVECVAKAIKQLEFTGKLILITDGRVDSINVDKCDAIMATMSSAIKEAEIYIVGDAANMSVSCPFTRTCPHTIKTYKNNQIDEIAIAPQDIALLDDIDQIQDIVAFDQRYDGICNALRARMMGRQDTDIKIHDQLVHLQNRLRKAFLKNQGNLSELEGLFINDTQKAFELLKLAFDKELCLPDFQNKIDKLLNMSKGGLRNVFNHELRRAPEVEVPTVIETNEEDLPFLCPITFDPEHSVALLIKEGPAVFEGLSPQIVADVMANPLNALHYSSIKDKIKALIDVPISGAAYLAYSIERSPLTRSPLKNVLYLGTHPSQIAGTNAGIADILTNGKSPGNLDLWYIVFYEIISSITYLKDILPQATEHLKYRLKHSQTYVALSNVPMPFNPRVSLGLAAWIIAMSPMLELPRQCDYSLKHAFHLDVIHKLVDLTGVCLSEPVISHAKYLKALYKLQMQHKNDRHNFTNTLKALYQKAMLIDRTWIPLDGPASEAQQSQVLEMLNMKCLTVEETHYLGSLTDPQIAYPTLSPYITIPQLPTFKTTWPYGIDTFYKPNTIVISRDTLRPHKPWVEQAEAFYGAPVHELISCNECYVRFVQSRKKHPSTPEEFVEFLYIYYVKNRNRETLPAPILQFASEVLAENKSIAVRHTIEDYIRITNLKRMSEV